MSKEPSPSGVAPADWARRRQEAAVDVDRLRTARLTPGELRQIAGRISGRWDLKRPRAEALPSPAIDGKGRPACRDGCPARDGDGWCAIDETYVQIGSICPPTHDADSAQRDEYLGRIGEAMLTLAESLGPAAGDNVESAARAAIQVWRSP